MTKTILDVLAEHNDWAWSGERREVLCIGCDWSQKIQPIDPAAEVFRTHQAAALSAAGFGLVADAKGEAFDYGWREGNGWPTPVNIETGELLHDQGRPAPFNPYRTEASS